MLPSGGPGLVLLALALAALAGGAVALRRWIRSRAPLRLVRRLRRSAPRYPVVLAHGLFGFDELRLGAARHEYFRDVAARLEADGWAVHRPRVAKAGSIEARAAELARFNAEVADAPGVTYGSVVAVARRKRDVSPLLLPTYVWLAAGAGGGDGVVPAASQRWGELLAEVDADHWGLIGWSGGFDAAGLHASLLDRLRARGL